jgi:hypothetical protein
MQGAWQEYQDRWPDEDRNTFNDMAVIAHYLVDCYERGALAEFPAAFSVLEQCLAQGDMQVRDAATIGVIEDLQNIASHRSFAPKAIEPWLQPLSRTAWEKLAASWREVSSLADMLRKETGVAPQSAQMPDVQQVQDPELRQMLESLYRKQ